MAAIRLPVEINEKEVMADIEFDYDEGQPLIMHPVDDSQEGIPASVEITEIRGPGGEDLSVYLTQSQVWDLETVITESCEEPDDEPEPEMDMNSFNWNDLPSEYDFM